MRHWLAFGVAVAFTCVGASARANDSMAEAPVGGLTLTKSDVIVMESEDLYISRDQVRVKYRFTNTSAAPVDTLVAFPLPEGAPTDPGDNSAYAGDLKSALKFRTTVDGKPLALELVEQAMFKNRDVADRLRTLGVPVNHRDPAFSDKINKLPASERQRLVDDGLIADDGAGDAKIWDGQWIYRPTVTRHQVFPAGRTIVVEHSYVPMVGGSVGGELDADIRVRSDNKDYFQEMKAKYCIDDDWLRSFDQGAKTHKRTQDAFAYREVWVGYVLKSGANWKGPIRDFRLVVDKGRPDSLVSFCATGVKKISPTQFEVRSRDFTPTADLNILIVDWTKPSAQ